MKSKEMSLPVKQAIIWFKMKNKPLRDTSLAKSTDTFKHKRKNTLVSSRTPKCPEDRGKDLWWMTEEFFPTSWLDQEYSPGGMCIFVRYKKKKTKKEMEQRLF